MTLNDLNVKYIWWRTKYLLCEAIFAFTVLSLTLLYKNIKLNSDPWCFNSYLSSPVTKMHTNTYFTCCFIKWWQRGGLDNTITLALRYFFYIDILSVTFILLIFGNREPLRGDIIMIMTQPDNTETHWHSLSSQSHIHRNINI